MLGFIIPDKIKLYEHLEVDLCITVSCFQALQHKLFRTINKLFVFCYMLIRGFYIGKIFLYWY